MSKLNQIRAIQLQKLFLVTIVAKVTLSYLAYEFQSPWILGFFLPLALMGVYIAIGFARSGQDVSDEKFGDSCYYLGFIFTISSIAFSLFDVPYLDQAGRLKDLAVRFGAAMVSTFLGIIVRIYLVGFKRDLDQSLEQLENRIVTAADELRVRMDMSIAAFRQFESAVHESTKDAVARSTMAVEAVGKRASTEFTAALDEVKAQAKEVYVRAAGEVQASAQHMSSEMRRSIQALQEDVRSRETDSRQMVAALQARLDAINIPADYFSRKFEPSVSALTSAIDGAQKGLNESVLTLAEGARQAKDALAELRTSMKASNAQLGAARKQEDVLASLASSLSQAADALSTSASTIKEQRELVAKLAETNAVRRQSANEVMQGLRTSAEQLASAASSLQKGSEGLHALLRELTELKLSLTPAATAAGAVRPAAVANVNHAGAGEATAAPRPAEAGSKRSIFGMRWR